MTLSLILGRVFPPFLSFQAVFFLDFFIAAAQGQRHNRCQFCARLAVRGVGRGVKVKAWILLKTVKTVIGGGACPQAVKVVCFRANDITKKCHAAIGSQSWKPKNQMLQKCMTSIKRSGTDEHKSGDEETAEGSGKACCQNR
jgi:hypothetical protein